MARLLHVLQAKSETSKHDDRNKVDGPCCLHVVFPLPGSHVELTVNILCP